MAAALRTVRKNTIQIAEEIPEEQYGFRAAEATRTVGELVSHIAHSDRFHQEIVLSGRLNLDGFDFQQFMSTMLQDTNKPRAKAELIDVLRTRGETFASQVEGLGQDWLGEHITFPAGGNPPSKSRFEILLGVKEHEMHHRGQLMLIERMLGLTPHLTREAELRRAAMMEAMGKK